MKIFATLRNMPWPRFLCRGAGALFVFLLAAMPMLAAEGAQDDPTNSTTGLVFRWINFLIVAGGAAFLIGKHGGAFFNSNAREIAASITEATEEKAAADQELREVETKIARLDQEVTELREAARHDSAAETDRLRESGHREIEKIRHSARAELAAAERVAQQELRAAAASMAVEQAGTIMSRGMTSEVRSKILRAFLGEVGRSDANRRIN